MAPGAWRSIVVGVALAALCLLHHPAVAATPVEAYTLSPKEIEILRQSAGEDTHAIMRHKQLGKRLDRIFRSVVGTMGGRLHPDYRQFQALMAGPAERSEIFEERFFFVPGNALKGSEAAAFIVDLVSGQLAVALLTHERFRYAYMTIREMLCADGRLKTTADRRFHAWAEEVRIRSGESPRGFSFSTSETSCQSPAVTEMPAPVKPPRKLTGPRDRLSKVELAVARTLVGRPGRALKIDPQIGGSIDRIFGAIAHRPGFYSGYFDKDSSSGVFYGLIFSGIQIRLIDDRFLVSGGCHGQLGTAPCWLSGAMALDLDTGHAAFAIVHRFDAEGKVFYERGHLTIFMRSCADPALRDFAKTHFPAWAKSELEHAYREDIRSVAKPSIMVSQCR